MTTYLNYRITVGINEDGHRTYLIGCPDNAISCVDPKSVSEAILEALLEIDEECIDKYATRLPERFL